jgi:hypothetical protein
MQRYQTIIFEFRNENTTGDVYTLDGLVTLSDCLNLNPSRRSYIKPISAQLSTRIPNIYSFESFNNRVIRVKRKVSDAWTTITLTPGIYETVSEITAAITSAISGWYTNPLQPALSIAANIVTDQVYIVLDSSKLSAGGTQMCVDLSQSQIAWTLGFPVASTFIVDGLFTSSQVVRMDTQGTYCDVICNLSNARYVNGQSKKILFSCPLTKMTGLTEFIYPINGNNVPMIQYTGSSYVANYSIEFKTQDNNKMVWLDGSKAQVIFEFEQEI